MDIDQLTAFERIVREGSFSKAAWLLGIAQPTISARIQALEQGVGGALFTRNGRHVALTPLGSSFLPYARRALAILAEGIEAAQMVEHGQRGRVTLGSLNSLAEAFLGPVVARFYAEHPDVELYVRSGDHERVVGLLCDGIVELGLVTWPCLDPLIAGHTPLLLLREPVIVACAPTHPLAQREEVTQSDLLTLGCPLLVGRWWVQHNPAMVRLSQQATTVLHVPIETARALVVAGMGVGFFTRAYIHDEIANGRVVPLSVRDLAPITRDSVLVRGPRSTPMSTATSTFVSFIREQAAQRMLLREDV